MPSTARSGCAMPTATWWSSPAPTGRRVSDRKLALLRRTQVGRHNPREEGAHWARHRRRPGWNALCSSGARGGNHVTRIKTLLLSISLVAATAAPALAYDRLPSGPSPTGFAGPRFDRRLDRQDDEEQRRLEQDLAARATAERGRLEQDLRHYGVSAREARLERQWLAEKQSMRADSDQDWLANKDAIRARYERAWQAEQDHARIAYERAGLGRDRDTDADVYARRVAW